MPDWKEGDRVRIVERPVTEEDRKKNRYYEHMAGLVGTVQNVYGPDEIAVKIDLDSLTAIAAEVHQTSTQRMREKFFKDTSEEQKKQLTPEELNFVPHYVLLVRAEDLVSA